MALNAKSGAMPFGAWAAVGAELWSSFWMFQSVPTDSIGNFYPTTWSYVGEHFLAWIVIAAPLFALFNVGLRRTRSNPVGLIAFFAVFAISVIAELASSAYLWYVATLDGNEPKLWYTGNFLTYLQARVIPWVFFFTFMSVVEVFVRKMRRVSNAQ